MFRNYHQNISFGAVFKKQKKINAVVVKPQTKKKEVFQVRSPEQIVIKCARAAYVR
jgi:hypothetical protein